ncbi:MAG: FAD:protein FMN transferase [Clostridiales bacterium]|nr:FAD:protein FMN transferase [Clostridiales bacterium]
MKKAVSVILTALVISAVCVILCGCAAVGYTVFDATACFSEDILFSAQIMGGRADYAHKRMTAVITEIDKQVSLTRADSDLNRFNRAAEGERVPVGKHTYTLFNLALEYYDITGGAFNCAAEPLSELWHVDATSIAEQKGALLELPSPSEVQGVLSYCNPTSVTAQTTDGAYYLIKSDERTKLDFGGIAKGYAVDECVKILREYDVTSALLDISGNAYFYGRRIEGSSASDWHVGVTSPRPRAGQTLSRGYVCALSLGGDESAVTSGDYMRYYVQSVGGKDVYVPHIIGASGVPIGVEYKDGEWKNSDEWVISATVIGKSSAVCDILSTAVCALGMDEGARLLKKVGYKGLIFTEKRFTIIGDVQLYKPDIYNGHAEYVYDEL